MKAVWLNKLVSSSKKNIFKHIIILWKYFPMLLNILWKFDFCWWPKWPVLYIPWIYLIILYYLLDTLLFHLHYYEQPCGEQPYTCPRFTFLSSPFTNGHLLGFSHKDDLILTTCCVFHLSSICTYDLDTYPPRPNFPLRCFHWVPLVE